MNRPKWKLPEGATWRQKIEQEHPNHGKIVPVPPRMQKRFGTGTMLIPRPRDVVTVMRRPRKGRLISTTQIRDELARMAGADSACPMTTGMFILIAAEAAEEARREGRKRITPYWRTVKDGGKLNERFPGGVRAQAARLREEGLTIRPGKGRQPPTVEDFEKHQVRPLPGH